MVKVPAKDEVEYLKEGDDVVKKTTSYQVQCEYRYHYFNREKEVFKQDGAKSTVVVTPIQPSVHYEKAPQEPKAKQKSQ